MTLPDYAVVVGIQTYPYFGPDGTPATLQAPVRNAEAIGDWLTKKGGVPDDKDHYHLIVDSVDGAGAISEPTKAKIEESLHRIARRAQEQKDKGLGELIGRRLYIYMSGHGWSPSVQQSCLFTANASAMETYNVFASGWLRWFQDAAYFREFVLWMDCCMDRLSSFPPGSIDKPFVPGRMASGPSFVSFAAQRPLKAAEVYNPQTNTQDGAFTWALLDGLNGAAVDPNGRVTGRSLADWLRQSVLARLPDTAKKDYDVAKEPDIASESSELIFARELPPLRYKVEIKANAMPVTGELIVFTGSPLRDADRIRLNGGPVTLSLAPGLYHVEHSEAPLAANFDVVRDCEVLLSPNIALFKQSKQDELFILEYDPPDPAVEITVIDHNFAGVERGIGKLITRLPAGLFKLRVRTGRNIEDTVLLLDRDMASLTDNINAPVRAMVAPISGTTTAHEYHAGAVDELAVRSEAERTKSVGETSGISLLVRMFSAEGASDAAMAPWDKVRIVDARGNDVLVADQDVRAEVGQDPFALAATAVAPGQYLLRHILDGADVTNPTAQDEVVLEQSLIVPVGWNLEVHVLRRVVDGKADIRPRIALHTVRQGQIIGEEERGLLEIARIALADERPVLGIELEQLLIRKFDNPIAGILGAHLLILGQENGQMFEPGLLNTIVRNLRISMGDDHPDVEALSLRCTDERLRTKQRRMAHAPMFERSWRLLVEASYAEPRLLSDRLVAQLLAPTALPPYLVWAESAASRKGTLKQLHEAVWAPRDLTQAPVEAGLPPIGQPIAAASMASPGVRVKTANEILEAPLSRQNRDDRRLARDRAANLNLPSNAFGRLLDREVLPD